jgi:hypothetical protein
MEANKLFLKHKRKYIKKLTNKAMTNFQIDEIAKKEFTPWRGCNSQDAIIWKPGYQTINNDISSGPGIHWIAIFIRGKTIYVYDSFGRPTPKLLKILTQQAKNRSFKIVDSQYDKEQFGNKSEICGQLSLSWLTVVRELGIKQALKI